MKPYTIDLVANTPKLLDIGGTLLVVDTAPTPFRIDFLGVNGNRRDEYLDAAQAADFATPENGFGKVLLTSPVTQTVKFYVSRGRTGRNVFTGTVAGTLGTLLQVLVNGANALVVAVKEFFNDETTKAGQAFHFGAVVGAGGAVTFQHVQLLNPAGSTVIVYVDRVRFSNNTGGLDAYHLRQVNAALPTDVGAGINKDSGGAAAQAHIRTQAPGALQGTLVEAQSLATAAAGEIVFDPPWRLAAGEGLAIAEAVGNIGLNVAYQWREKAA
jgi:hypothetical protein